MKIDQDQFTGLSEKEAFSRLKKEGPNELPSQKRRGSLKILINVLQEPMLLLLAVCALIYIFIGETSDSLMLVAAVFAVIFITFYQERKTERALEALRNLSSPRALVIREGIQKRIPGREVVREDIIFLREGDRIPADALVLSSVNLVTDESLLTGESLPVKKTEWDKKPYKVAVGGEDTPFVFSGTLVINGHGFARVLSTGSATEMGKIGKALETITEEETLLRKETARLVRDIGALGLVSCGLVVLIYGLAKHNWTGGFLAGITLGMSMIPEEFSVVLVIFLSLGAWRISKKGVLTRKTASIETLGAATVFCVDKTGTLTQNSMSLSEISVGDEAMSRPELAKQNPPEIFHQLLEYSLLASQKDPFDPIETEIRVSGSKFLKGTEHLHDNWELIKEYPLTKELMAISHVWESPDKENYVIASKGAPEAILDLCHAGENTKKDVMGRVHSMAGKGLRILGVAKAEFNRENLPEKQHDYEFTFLGLIGFADPVRDNVKSSLAECYRAGIRVIMITGDYPGTAKNIAKQIGLKEPEKVITGQELAAMGRAGLAEKIQTVNVFSRVVPEQKLLLVDALKANGEIVAMTGDGVNDAPALKSSNIGIAMGARGTDVARESADLVLLNDDFSSIVSAVKLGRRIFENLRKAMSYIFAIHIPIAGTALVPVIFNLPIVLLPAHIAFLELIIDPACSIVFEQEPGEGDIMARPPRPLKEKIFNRSSVVYSVFQGLSVLFVVIFVYLAALYMGKSELETRTLTFATLVIANLGLIITNVSRTKVLVMSLFSKNSSLRIILALAFGSLLTVIFVPALRSLFHFSPLSFMDLGIALIAGTGSILWFELLKLFGRLAKD